MVTFDVVAALVAGLVGTVAMTLMMQAATAMGMTRMPSMPLILGTMVASDEGRAKTLGLIGHVIVMGTVVFGLVYAAMFVAFDDAGVATGALVGVVHGIVAGLVVAVVYGLLA